MGEFVHDDIVDRVRRELQRGPMDVDVGPRPSLSPSGSQGSAPQPRHRPRPCAAPRARLVAATTPDRCGRTSVAWLRHRRRRSRATSGIGRGRGERRRPHRRASAGSCVRGRRSLPRRRTVCGSAGRRVRPSPPACGTPTVGSDSMNRSTRSPDRGQVGARRMSEASRSTVISNVVRSVGGAIVNTRSPAVSE